MHTFSGAPLNQTPLGQIKSVLNSEVSSFQGLLSTQMRHLGLTKVSCLWRCVVVEFMIAKESFPALLHV